MSVFRSLIQTLIICRTGAEAKHAADRREQQFALNALLRCQTRKHKKITVTLDQNFPPKYDKVVCV